MTARDRTTLDIPVDRQADGMRVDRFLRRMLPEVPLSRLHAMIRTGGVTAGGARLAAGDRLALGQTVAVAVSPQDAAAARGRLGAGAAAGATAGTGGERARSLPILYRDEHVIVFDKPSGVAAHPGSGHALDDTVLGALLVATGTPARAAFKPSLVGRLDRDASGVQLAGTTVVAVRELERLQRAGEIRKTYLALVRGHDLADSGRIDAALLDTGGGARRMRAMTGARDPRAVEAATVYRVVERFATCSLLEVELETGRQHQIRAHFAGIDAPLAGDVRYGAREWNATLARHAGLVRLFLHCARVRFAFPADGRPVDVRSPLPDDLARTLAALRTGRRAPST